MSARKKQALSETSIYTGIAITTALLTATFVVIGGVSHLPSGDHASVIDTTTDKPLIASDNTQPTPGPAEPHAPAPSAPHTDVDAPDEAPKEIVHPASMNTPPTQAFVADNMRLDTPHLSFSAAFPAGAHEQPAYQSIMTRMSKYRDKLSADAATEADIANQAGVEFRPWEIDIQFTETARTGDFVSMIGQEYANTGGAHPNTDFMGVVANTKTGEPISISDMFLPRRENSPALMVGVCEALKTVKTDRIGFAEVHGEEIDCGSPDFLNRLSGSETTLAPSTDPEKAGGFQMYFAPYSVGAYAEGPYMVTVGHYVFANDLRPEYKALFGGEPVSQ